MTVKQIQSDEQYQAALKEVAPFFEGGPPEMAPDSERFDTLMLAIGEYESKFYTYHFEKS